jgi:hypothetical protein
MTKASFLFCVIGNCQANALSIFIDKLYSKAVRIVLPAIHLIDLQNLTKVWDILDNVDVIIHQPISDSFGDLGIESLKFKYPDKKYISFPSVFFDGYFPHLGYLRKPGGGTLKGALGDYHDFRIVESFLEGKGEKEICSLLNYKVTKEVTQHSINTSFERLREREADLDIQVTAFIKNNLFSTQLFHVFNHPTNIVLLYLAKEIVKKMGGESRLFEPKKEVLGSLAFPVDRSVANFFDEVQTNKYYLSIPDGEEHYYQQKEFVAKQVEIYNKIPNLKELYLYALKKRELLGY